MPWNLDERRRPPGLNDPLGGRLCRHPGAENPERHRRLRGRRQAADKAGEIAGREVPTTLAVARQGGWWIVALVVCAGVVTAAESLLPAAIGRLIDAVVDGEASSRWLLASGVLITVLVAAEAADEIASASSMARTTQWLRTLGLRRLIFASFDAGRGTKYLASRLTGNAADGAGIGPDLIAATTSTLLGLAGVIALGVIDPWLLLTFLVALPCLAVIVMRFVSETADVSARYLDAQGEIVVRLAAALRGSRTIAAAGTADTEERRILEPLPDLSHWGRSTWRIQGQTAGRDGLLLGLLEVAVLGVAGLRVAHGALTPGQLFAAGEYVLLAATLTNAVSALGGIITSRAALRRLNPVMGLPQRIYGDAEPHPGKGAVEFSDVHYATDGGSLRLDLTIPGGSFVAVVGASGAGKTRLAALAGRMVDPDQGSVLVDGCPLGGLSRSALRTLVTYAFEDPALLGDTLEAAVAFGCDRPARPLVEDAIDLAGAGFVRRLPAGVHTRVASAPLSGGELQRVGLARAFAHPARVLVLDDVASSLDSVTEAEIAEVLTGPLGETTRIVVAHRLSTCARADLVLWLEAGRVRGYAPLAELQEDPDFQRLFGHPVEVPVIQSIPQLASRVGLT